MSEAASDADEDHVSCVLNCNSEVSIQSKLLEYQINSAVCAFVIFLKSIVEFLLDLYDSPF